MPEHEPSGTRRTSSADCVGSSAKLLRSKRQNNDAYCAVTNFSTMSNRLRGILMRQVYGISRQSGLQVAEGDDHIVHMTGHNYGFVWHSLPPPHGKKRCSNTSRTLQRPVYLLSHSICDFSGLICRNARFCYLRWWSDQQLLNSSLRFGTKYRNPVATRPAQLFENENELHNSRHSKLYSSTFRPMAVLRWTPTCALPLPISRTRLQAMVKQGDPLGTCILSCKHSHKRPEFYQCILPTAFRLAIHCARVIG